MPLDSPRAAVFAGGGVPDADHARGAVLDRLDTALIGRTGRGEMPAVGREIDVEQTGSFHLQRQALFPGFAVVQRDRAAATTDEQSPAVATEPQVIRRGRLL